MNEIQAVCLSQSGNGGRLAGQVGHKRNYQPNVKANHDRCRRAAGLNGCYSCLSQGHKALTGWLAIIPSESAGSLGTGDQTQLARVICKSNSRANDNNNSNYNSEFNLLSVAFKIGAPSLDLTVYVFTDSKPQQVDVQSAFCLTNSVSCWSSMLKIGCTL